MHDPPNRSTSLTWVVIASSLRFVPWFCGDSGPLMGEKRHYYRGLTQSPPGVVSMITKSICKFSRLRAFSNSSSSCCHCCRYSSCSCNRCAAIIYPTCSYKRANERFDRRSRLHERCFALYSKMWFLSLSSKYAARRFAALYWDVYLQCTMWHPHRKCWQRALSAQTR